MIPTPGQIAKTLIDRRPRLRVPRRTPAGTAPGTLIADPDSPPPRIHVIAFGEDAVDEAEVDGVDALRDHLGRRPVTWINVAGIGDADAIQAMGDVFGLHRLALEDVMNVHQRAKVEEYPDHLFIVLRMAQVANGAVETEQLSIFLGRDYVLTFQERRGDCLDPVRQRLRAGRGRISAPGSDYLAYALIDAVVDHYFPVLEHYGERLEALENAVVHEPEPDTLTAIHQIKRELLALRRGIWPLREAISSLLRDPVAVVTDETRLYLRDCYDHTIQVIDLLENYREIASGLLDVYLSSISNRMNDVMRVLTVIATIFIPLTFIAGIYGTNFDTAASPWNLPELHWYWGYPFMLGVMLVIVLGLLAFFRRKGWL